jgi:hypothetical protein
VEVIYVSEVDHVAVHLYNVVSGRLLSTRQCLSGVLLVRTHEVLL